MHEDLRKFMTNLNQQLKKIPILEMRKLGEFLIGLLKQKAMFEEQVCSINKL